MESPETLREAVIWFADFEHCREFMIHRIRLAMQDAGFNKLGGHVEADETFIGGKARNMHVGARRRRITGTGTKDKTAVMGIMERGGMVRTAVVPNRKKHALQEEA